MNNKIIKVTVGGNTTSVSDEDIKEELAKKGITGEIEITRIERDVFENKNVEKSSNSTKKKKNKRYWKKSQFWE